MHTDEEFVSQNRASHDKFAANYDAKHTEIFNAVEQARIAALLEQAKVAIQTDDSNLSALDLGAGTGNLTRHMLRQGLEVTASDVSEGSLRLLAQQTDGAAKTVLSNGRDLGNFADGQFDLAATYSVLHHIPDYLSAVSEMIRVVKPGGVVFIDHEASPSYWTLDHDYMNYLRQLRGDALGGYLWSMGEQRLEPLKLKLARRARQLLSPRAWRGFLIRSFRPNSATYCDNGDIHVFKADHIDWTAVRKIITAQCEIVLESDYLVCREREDSAPCWTLWHEKLSDMRVTIARKRNADG